MFGEGRQQLILRRLARDGRVRVSDLAHEWGTSAMTIRRDLSVLEEQGLLRRTYGGAVPLRLEEVALGPRVGLLFPHKEYYFGEVVSGAERAARTHGCRLVLASHFYDSNLEHQRLAKLAELSLDGLIMANVEEPGRKPPGIGAALRSLDLPVVLVEREPHSRFAASDPDVVRTAHSRGAELAVEHLYALGHRRILTMLTPSATSVHLRRGVAKATTDLGIAWIDHPCPEPDGGSALAAEVARRCVDERLAAAFVHTDIQALALFDALRDQGVAVPGDLHLVTYDDELAAKCPVPLTAVAPPRHELGYEAVRMVMQRIESDADAVARQLFLMPRLMVRASAPHA